jgi:hypothetical protein
MTRTASTILITTLLGVAPALGLGACGGEPAPKVKKSAEDEGPSAADNVKFELPPPPDFDEGKVAEKWDDGSWSLYGLRKTIDDNVKAGDAGQEIEVKGFVQDIYEPPVCPEGEKCPPGKQPHIWITDKADEKGKKRAMMVVGYRMTIPDYDAKRWEKIPDVVFEKGKQYTFKGKFRRFSDQGFADARGLLEFTYYKAVDPATGQEGWIAPRNAPWHPLELLRVEEEQRKLVEKVNKDAAKKKGK